MTSRRRAVPGETIQRLAAQAFADPARIAVFAGTSEVQAAPQGLGNIIGRSRGGTLGFTGGLTLIKHAADFTIPTFSTRNEAVRQGGEVHHYAEVMATSASDAVHESFYAGPGDHLRPGMTQRIGSRVYNHYWRISPMISELIRRGEEEHLADAQRAYELTYKLIADTINAMAAGTRFGPARNPQEADRLAEAELAKRLPRELGTDPRNWVAVLDRLLDLTKERDRRGWHSLDINPDRTERNRIIHPVVTMSTTSIGDVSSSELVRY